MQLVVGYVWDGVRRSGLVAQGPRWSAQAALEADLDAECSHSGWAGSVAR
jgi:hypothetical protein